MTTESSVSGYVGHVTSGRFVKQEQWERWRAKRKLVPGSKHQGASVRCGGITPKKFRDFIRKITQYSAIWSENGSQCHL